MPTSPEQPERPAGHDNGTPSNESTRPAQGKEGRREDEHRESGARIKGPGFGKGSNAV
jgi:hypothetical protein